MAFDMSIPPMSTEEILNELLRIDNINQELSAKMIEQNVEIIKQNEDILYLLGIKRCKASWWRRLILFFKGGN